MTRSRPRAGTTGARLSPPFPAFSPFLPPHAAAPNRDDAIAPDNIFSLSFQFRFVIILPVFRE
ncbi:hypothetical protein [Burkholderia metallica]|nr:hypothetical protein [Burkholderia metallica]MCA8002673.1 hypothetical protein [Burkholderia metallica]MCA8019976.1 hypothetical protein [Burkholderia metallica]